MTDLIRSCEYFSKSELCCPCGECDGGGMHPFFMKQAVAMRENLGFALSVTSGYRCPVYNDRISSTGLTGPHTTHRALDIAVSGHTALLVIESAHRYGILGPSHGGLGVKQHGPHAARFIHLDNLNDLDTHGPRPWVWSYK